MAKSLAQLKKGRKDAFKSIQEEVEKQKKPSFETDERFWRPTRDKNNNVIATIRFLPAPPDSDWGEEEHAFVKVIEHNFKGKGKRFYDNASRKTLGEDFDDPVAEYNSYLWDTVGTEESKKQASKQKRIYRYISNVLVVNDPENKDNNGKVFLYKYGKKIFDKISSAMSPPSGSSLKGCNIFDPWEGKNFELQGSDNTVDGLKFLDYGASQFHDKSPISENDEEIDAIWGQAYSLNQFITEANTDYIKTYEELVKDLEKCFGTTMDKLMSGSYTPVSNDESVMENVEKQDAKMENFMADDDEDDDIPDFSSTKTAKPTEDSGDDEDLDLQGLADLEGLDDI